MKNFEDFTDAQKKVIKKIRNFAGKLTKNQISDLRPKGFSDLVIRNQSGAMLITDIINALCFIDFVPNEEYKEILEFAQSKNFWLPKEKH